MWTKSACVVLAWGLPLILMAVGMGAVRPAQANIRIASSSTELTLTSTPHAVAATRTSPGPTARYVVRPGDTLSGIAATLAVRGGWQALYAANRPRVGPDPNVIHAGTVLLLPGRKAPLRYTVAAGDTLSGVAAALAVPGGWPALYAANRRAIGPDPNTIQPGTVLRVPGPVPPVPRSASQRPEPHVTPPPALPGGQHRPPAPRTRVPAATGMPRWLTTMLLAAGLLITAAFIAEPVLMIVRRRRQTARRRAAEKGRIVMADYDRLVVTHCKATDTVYVLRPPAEDPKAILRVARLVLKEEPYEELAGRLGVPANWPLE